MVIFKLTNQRGRGGNQEQTLTVPEFGVQSTQEFEINPATKRKSKIINSFLGTQLPCLENQSLTIQEIHKRYKLYC
uniref:Uncharacterized protein n=1 Tax=Lepeophtheirus salmonis TaxID=72036 RepID=A0A0K2TUH2_LEPSM